MSDLQRMGGETEPPETFGGETVLTGCAPVAALWDYAREVTVYTRGRGHLLCQNGGYRPCTNAGEVIATAGYEAERDVENTADSVFCGHGAGYNVKWNEVPMAAHMKNVWRRECPAPQESVPERQRTVSTCAGTAAQEKELQAIFERTYGAVKRPSFTPPVPPRRAADTADSRRIRTQPSAPEYLLVDGYNIIFAWDELKAIAREHLDAARIALCDLLCNYQGYRKNRVIVVFDAYKVKGGQGSVEQYHNIHVVYTKEAETADAYIEKTTYELGRSYRVKVATSDGPEQLIILGHGALRMSASAFREEVETVQSRIGGVLEQNNRQRKTGNMRAAMERAMVLEENSSDVPPDFSDRG